MTKKFEVGSYAINNKGIGIAGPQSTIYKVVSIENVTSGVANEDIEKAINVAYLDDDCEVLEQRLHEITNIKVEEK